MNEFVISSKKKKNKNAIVAFNVCIFVAIQENEKDEKGGRPLRIFKLMVLTSANTSIKF